MNKYSIVTIAEVTSEYLVKANNEEEAKEKVWKGKASGKKEISSRYERIDYIELDEENIA